MRVIGATRRGINTPCCGSKIKEHERRIADARACSDGQAHALFFRAATLTPPAASSRRHAGPALAAPASGTDDGPAADSVSLHGFARALRLVRLGGAGADVVPGAKRR